MPCPFPVTPTIHPIWLHSRREMRAYVRSGGEIDSHRLRAMGFSVRQTAVTVGLLTGAIGLASLSLRHLELAAALLHLLAIAMLFGVIGALEFIGRRNAK